MNIPKPMHRRQKIERDEMVAFLANWVDNYRFAPLKMGAPKTIGRAGRSSPIDGGRVQLVGDDLFVTNTERLQARDRCPDCK